jgi:peptidoglycan/LPS O-acetylase OafA/YrhL
MFYICDRSQTHKTPPRTSLRIGLLGLIVVFVCLYFYWEQIKLKLFYGTNAVVAVALTLCVLHDTPHPAEAE